MGTTDRMSEEEMSLTYDEYVRLIREQEMARAGYARDEAARADVDREKETVRP